MAKILYITPIWFSDKTKVSPKVCNSFAADWVRQGHSVVVIHYRSVFPAFFMKMSRVFPYISKKIFSDNYNLNVKNEEYHYEENGMTVFSLPIFKLMPHGNISDKGFYTASQRLIEIIAGLDFIPDAIIGHFVNPALGIITRLKLQYPTAKTSIVMHEDVETLRKTYPMVGETLLNSIDSVGFRSMKIKESVESGICLSNHRFMCYSGVPVSYLEKEPIEREWNDAPLKNFIYVGRIVPYKHPESVAKALNLLYKDHDFTLSYVGNKSNAYKRTLAYCKKSGIADRVTFYGLIPRETIIEKYDHAECFVMISSGEVFGLVYLEAMARGCITIAGDDSGMVGIIEHGKNGYLCKPGDEKQLASIINEINNLSADQKSIISRNARETALNFSDYKVAQHYIENVL